MSWVSLSFGKVGIIRNEILFVIFLSERPDPPVNVSLFDASPLRISARWTPTYNGNRPVLTFMVYVRDVNESSQFTFLESVMASSVTPSMGVYSKDFMNSSLIFPFSHYSLRIKSCNAIGCSDESAASDAVRTDEYSE